MFCSQEKEQTKKKETCAFRFGEIEIIFRFLTKKIIVCGLGAVRRRWREGGNIRLGLV